MLSTMHVPDILAHWHIPEEQAPLFWALLRKHTHFEHNVLPENVKLDDLQQVLIKFLRRVRDRLCTTEIAKGKLLTQNDGTFEDKYRKTGLAGKGAFGECFWVTHKTTKHVRVAKNIPKGASVPEEAYW